MLLLQELGFRSLGRSVLLRLLMILKFRLFMSKWFLMTLELRLLMSLWLLSFLHHDSTIFRYLSLQLTLVMTTTGGFSYANINDNWTNQQTKGHLQHLECCTRPF